MKSCERKKLITYSGDPLFCTVKSREIIKRFSVHFSTFRNFLKIEGQCSRRLGLRFLWPTRRALSYGGKPFFSKKKSNCYFDVPIKIYKTQKIRTKNENEIVNKPILIDDAHLK